MSKTLLIAVAAVASLLVPTTLHAQKQADPPKQDQKQEQEQKAKAQETEKTDAQKAAEKAAEDQKKKVDEYEKAVKELTRVEGAFTFYTRKKDVLLELPEKDLGRLFLIQATFGTGSSTNGTQAGDAVGDNAVDAFRFQREEDQVWLVRPNTNFRWSPEDPLGLAGQRSFPEAILGSFRIEQEHPVKKRVLVNVTQLFYGDVFRLNELINSGVGGQYMLDREKCLPDTIKSFEQNAVVRMRLHFLSPRGAERNPLLALLGLGGTNTLADSRSLPVSVSYNMWYRVDSGYRPRLRDPRVGYFSEEFFSVDRLLQPDQNERYIMRWDLRKKDPAAAVSEPVKPIVWYLDPSIPPAFREACRDGLLRWNKAFDALGYKNAVVVKDAPVNDPDWDHADGRFNVVRWTLSPDPGYAVSIVRIDPFSGEILNAGITFDANMLAFAKQEHRDLATPATDGLQRSLQILLRDSKRREPDDAFLWAPEKERATDGVLAHMRAQGWKRLDCRYARGLGDSASLAWNALEAAPAGSPINPDQYAREFIADVISHELGHCLGLRHNFAASTALTTAQLGDDALTSQQSLTASVMDYTPVNIVAVLRGRGNFFAPTLGKYDLWAVQYGYTDIKAYSPVGERYELDRIAARSTEPGLAFMTDENADDWNPYVARFDQARDPLAYSLKNLEAASRVKEYALKKLPANGEGYGKRTNLILQAMNRVFREGRMSARFVGGVSATRSHGVPNALAPVDPASQRTAVRLIAQNCLSANVARLPATVMNSLVMNPDLEDSVEWTAPLRTIVSRSQSMLYAMLTSSSTVDRIAENALKSGQGAYTLEEHVAYLVGNVFTEVGQNQPIDPIRRDLQRYVVNALITQAGAPAGAIHDDMRLLGTDALRSLSARMGKQLGAAGNLDKLSRLHLADSKETIDRFLARRFAIGK